MTSRGIPFFRYVLALLVAAGSLTWSSQVPAASAQLADADCAEILEKWQRDPDSVPRHLVDDCKERIAGAAPVETPAPVVPLAAIDPCSGPDAASSVYCWGPWASLAPAAGAPEIALASNLPTDIDCRFEIAEQCRATFAGVDPPEPPPELPLGGCAPGTPCGFATVVAGVTSSADPSETTFARIIVGPDGTWFVIDPEGSGEIRSVTGMGTVVTDRLTDDYENLRANGRDGDEQSRLVARVIRGEGNEILLAADIWGHGNRATGASNSGYFAWGTATSVAGLDALNAGNVSMTFSGPLSVDNATVANLKVDFGTNPVWAGTWTNPAWSFGAGGVVSAADLISEPGKFTENVVAEGSFVQGALLGEAGNRGLAHIIDVNLHDHGRIKDVGLLREVAGPAVTPAEAGH